MNYNNIDLRLSYGTIGSGETATVPKRTLPKIRRKQMKKPRITGNLTQIKRE
jgi:hypothetical protein